jgi:ribosomal protein S18 acetylase RimI-like enzyme
MTAALRRAGLEFPEERVRAGLRDSTTVIILLLDGATLAGYVEFGRDREHERDIYIRSLQLRERYRNTFALAVLLVEASRALAPLTFERLRTGVQKNNERAVRLYRKLGFTLTEREDNPASWRVEGGRDLLDSELMRRLTRAVAGRYRRAD